MKKSYPDSLSLPAATKLATRISEYWSSRGGIVETRLEPVSYGDERRVWAVRSDMINGQPSRWAEDREMIRRAA